MKRTLLAAFAAICAFACLASSSFAAPVCGPNSGELAYLRAQVGSNLPDIPVVCSGGRCLGHFIQEQGYLYQCPEWVADGEPVDKPRPEADCLADIDKRTWGGRYGDMCHNRPRRASLPWQEVEGATLPYTPHGEHATLQTFRPNTRGFQAYQCRGGKWVKIHEECGWVRQPAR